MCYHSFLEAPFTVDKLEVSHELRVAPIFQIPIYVSQVRQDVKLSQCTCNRANIEICY